MRTVYQCVKSNVAVSQIKSFVVLQHLHGTKIGTDCFNTRAYEKMIDSFGDSFTMRLNNYVNGGTDPMAIVIDTSTDISKMHLMSVSFQGNQNHYFKLKTHEQNYFIHYCRVGK